MTIDSGKGLKSTDRKPGSSKENDYPEDEVLSIIQRGLGNKFDYRLIRPWQEFAQSYHIKVVVRDDDTLWLSSGNWQGSNQPELSGNEDPSELNAFNRDWHVILKNSTVAAQFREFMKFDFDRADNYSPEAGFVDEDRPDLFVPDEYFEEVAGFKRDVFGVLDLPQKKVKIQPLLTPDNYIDVVAPLVAGAKQRLWIQNQYLRLAVNNDQRFIDLYDNIIEQARNLEDFRLIVRDLPGAGDDIEALSLRGFPKKKVKIQPNAHTKAILIDSKITIMGSHNLSNQGTTQNRDASLIFYDKEITRYFEEIMDHDWVKLARYKNLTRRARVAEAEEAAPIGFTRIPWSQLFDSD